MAQMTIERMAATGEPFEQHERTCRDPLCAAEVLELDVDLECAGYDEEESELGHIRVHAGVTDVEATARGWPVELTESEREVALELVDREVRHGW